MDTRAVETALELPIAPELFVHVFAILPESEPVAGCEQVHGQLMFVSKVIAAFELVIPKARECRNRTCIK